MSFEGIPKLNIQENKNIEEAVAKKKPLSERLAEQREGKNAKDRMRKVLHLDVESFTDFSLPPVQFSQELEKRNKEFHEFVATDTDVELAYNMWKEVKDQLPSDVTKYYADRVLRFAFHSMKPGDKEISSEVEISRALEVLEGVRDSVHSDLPKTYGMKLVRLAFHLEDEAHILTETEKVLAKKVLSTVSEYVPPKFLEQYSRKLAI